VEMLEEAIGIIRAARDVNPLAGEMWGVEAAACAMLGDVDRSAALAAIAHALDPYDLSSCLLRARILSGAYRLANDTDNEGSGDVAREEVEREANEMYGLGLRVDDADGGEAEAALALCIQSAGRLLEHVRDLECAVAALDAVDEARAILRALLPRGASRLSVSQLLQTHSSRMANRIARFRSKRLP